MGQPILACCNFLPEAGRLRDFALTHGFNGVDWTFNLENFPKTPAAESALTRTIAGLQPLDLRYHCAFARFDLGAEDPEENRRTMQLLRRVCHLVAKLKGRVITIHIGGLGRESAFDLSWQKTLAGLTELVRLTNRLGLKLCIENLAWGWTSRPDLFEKLVRLSGAWATLDVGHARVSPAVASGLFRVRDFVTPHPERFINAHVYHEETEAGHLPPQSLADLQDRLELLLGLPLCNWWVLELREEATLLPTLQVVQEFLNSQGNIRQPASSSPEPHR
ncbi:MAG: TIM barrel protein [Thermodesulfobacteriota bacterium]